MKRAIAWVKRNIHLYGGDASRIVIGGGSAGAHLAALAALTPDFPSFQPGFEAEDTTVQVLMKKKKIVLRMVIHHSKLTLLPTTRAACTSAGSPTLRISLTSGMSLT